MDIKKLFCEDRQRTVGEVTIIQKKNGRFKIRYMTANAVKNNGEYSYTREFKTRQEAVDHIKKYWEIYPDNKFEFEKED